MGCGECTDLSPPDEGTTLGTAEQPQHLLQGQQRVDRDVDLAITGFPARQPRSLPPSAEERGGGWRKDMRLVLQPSLLSPTAAFSPTETGMGQKEEELGIEGLGAHSALYLSEAWLGQLCPLLLS